MPNSQNLKTVKLVLLVITCGGLYTIPYKLLLLITMHSLSILVGCHLSTWVPYTKLYRLYSITHLPLLTKRFKKRISVLHGFINVGCSNAIFNLVTRTHVFVHPHPHTNTQELINNFYKTWLEKDEIIIVTIFQI